MTIGSKFKKVWETTKSTFTTFGENNCTTLAAALSYYTIFSIAPMLVIVIALVGTFFGKDAVQGKIYYQINDLVGKDGALAIQGIIEKAYEPRNTLIATVIGIVTLIFGATGVFTQLKQSLNIIWNVNPQPKRQYLQYVVDRLLSFAYILGIGFVLIVTLVVSTAITAISEYLASTFFANYSSYFFKLLSAGISVAILSIIFTMMFKVLSDTVSRWQDIIVGGLLTAVLFTIGEILIGLYLGQSNFASTYGTAGSIIIVLVWVNYSSLILFLGASFTYVYANNYGTPIRPNKFSHYLREPCESPAKNPELKEAKKSEDKGEKKLEKEESKVNRES